LLPLAETLGMTIDQLALRIGLLAVSILPVVLILTTYLIKKQHKKDLKN
jgi:hypothetical protein